MACKRVRQSIIWNREFEGNVQNGPCEVPNGPHTSKTAQAQTEITKAAQNQNEFLKLSRFGVGSFWYRPIQHNHWLAMRKLS